MCVVVKGSNSVVSVGIVERIREKNSNTHRFSFYTVDCICSKKEKHWEFILTAGVATYTADCTCKTIGMFPKTYPPSFTHTHTHTHTDTQMQCYQRFCRLCRSLCCSVQVDGVSSGLRVCLFERERERDRQTDRIWQCGFKSDLLVELPNQG